MTKLIFWIAIIFISHAQAQTTEQLDAFNAGKAAGDVNANQTIFNNINHTQAGNAISSYTTTLPEQSSYWGGANSVIAPIYSGGNAKINQCGSGLSPPSPAEQQHCEAINAVVNTQTNLPANLITRSDPIVLKGTAVAANPEAIAGVISANYSECKTEQISNEAAFTLQTCEDWSETTSEYCSIGQKVDVDKDYIYRCKETISTINSGTCTYGNQIVVDADYNYRCEKTDQKTVRMSCQKLAVLSVESATTWGGAGQLVVKQLLYTSSAKNYRAYLEIYANPDADTYTFCMSSSRSASIWACDSNVYNGKSVSLLDKADFHAMWPILSCSGENCQVTGTGNFGCYSIENACSGGRANINFNFSPPMSITTVKKIAWQSNCPE